MIFVCRCEVKTSVAPGHYGSGLVKRQYEFLEHVCRCVGMLAKGRVHASRSVIAHFLSLVARFSVRTAIRAPGQKCFFFGCHRCKKRFFILFLLPHGITAHPEGPASAESYAVVFAGRPSAMVHFAAEFDLAVRARSDIDSATGAIGFHVFSRLRDALR